MQSIRNRVQQAQRIVIKVGSSSLTYPETGKLDLTRMELLCRELSSLHNAGKDVVLVSSGAIMVGLQALGLHRRPHVLSRVQACAAIGQARLMMLYQKFFSEYNQNCGQILLTKYSLIRPDACMNAHNTFEELLDLGVIPIVNENDTIATDEIEFGDNDSLSALVASLIHADLLILLSDIDGLYDDDPHTNPDAHFIEEVYEINEALMEGAKGASSRVGTGGMATKLNAARIACASNCDMIIANARDFHIIGRLIAGAREGTFFAAKPDPNFSFETCVEKI
ncbi:glutamate 5-kinase [Erysipelotrichaceae bacterium 51-3]|uniref:glutamate 5-kinase n=1 Tax=Allobaculum sp. JKK-2023 TaxID=3108943 RepID=UPI002B0563A6|nr:glutamate 5-kinase [Allobaculum sp. JKK-2023]